MGELNGSTPPAPTPTPHLVLVITKSLHVRMTRLKHQSLGLMASCARRHAHQLDSAQQMCRRESQPSPCVRLRISLETSTALCSASLTTSVMLLVVPNVHLLDKVQVCAHTRALLQSCF